jgi:hypothetical protein
LATGVLVGPLPAQAAPVNCQAPPGTSGIDQYCETVPAASGDQGTRPGGRGQNGSSGSSVSQRTAAALRRSGASGKAILGLSSGSGQGSSSGTGGGNANAAKGQTGAGNRGRGAAAGSQSTAPAGRSDNPLEAIRSAVTSGGSAGPGFVWILVILGAIMAGVGWLRYRRSTSD